MRRETGADVLLWDGSCIVHEEFKAQGIIDLKTVYPEAAVLVHPESPANVVAQADVVGHGAGLLGMEAPELVPFDVAAESMSKMALSFWKDDRLVSNRRLHEDLNVTLTYPTYREGLAAVLAAGG